MFEYCCSTLEALLDVAERPMAGQGARGAGGGGGGGWKNPFAAPARPQIGMARALKLGFELSLAVRRLSSAIAKPPPAAGGGG